MSLTPETVIEKTLDRLNGQPKYIGGQKLEKISADRLRNFGAYSYIQALSVYRDLCLYFLSQAPGGEAVMQEFSGDPAPHEAAARAIRKIKLDKNYQVVYSQLCVDLDIPPTLLPKAVAPEPAVEKGTIVTFSFSEPAKPKPSAPPARPAPIFDTPVTLPPQPYELNINSVMDAALKEYNKLYKPKVDTDRYDIQHDSSDQDAIVPRDIITFSMERLHQQRDSDLRRGLIKLHLGYRDETLIDAANLRVLEKIIEKDDKTRNMLMAVARAAELDMTQSVAFIRGNDVVLDKKQTSSLGKPGL